MLPVTEIEASLMQFTGSDSVHRHWSDLVYTEGVRFIANACGAYWLIEAIASYQHQFRKDPMLREIQFWTLRRNGEGWELICERDSGDVAICQLIEYSDFPLNEIKLYVTNHTILLPSEY